MIDFELASGLPSILDPADLSMLGRVLARRLKLRKKYCVGIRFVTIRVMQTLNQRYRKIRKPTDVLSFAPAKLPIKGSFIDKYSLGDLVLCPSYVKKNRLVGALFIPMREELIRLIAHGVLHLLGFDHATPHTEARMFSLQEKCVSEVKTFFI